MPFLMYGIEYTNRFKKDLKRCKKRGFNIAELERAVELLQQDGKLPKKYKSHTLKGDLAGLWECHLKPDWLLVWQQNDDILELLFMMTGSHSDLL